MPVLFREFQAAMKATLLISEEHIQHLGKNKGDFSATFQKAKHLVSVVHVKSHEGKIVFSFSSLEDRTKFLGMKFSLRDEGKVNFEFQKPKSKKKNHYFITLPDTPVAAADKDIKEAISTTFPGCEVDSLKRGSPGEGFLDLTISSKQVLFAPFPNWLDLSGKSIPMEMLSGKSLAIRIIDRDKRKEAKEAAARRKAKGKAQKVPKVVHQKDDARKGNETVPPKADDPQG